MIDSSRATVKPKVMETIDCSVVVSDARAICKLAGATALEPAASCVTGRRSNQLNYALALNINSLKLPWVPLAACPFLKLPDNAVTGTRSVVTEKPRHGWLPKAILEQLEIIVGP